MSLNFNRVILGGNLTRDPEVKFTPGNTAIASFGVAVNRRWKTPEGEQREEVTFVDCDAFGKTAEFIGKFFTKGRPIMIEGRLKLDQWTDKQSNEKRSKLKVVIESAFFADSKPGGGGGGGGDDHSSAEASRVVTRSPNRPSAPAGSGGGGGGGGGEPMGEEDIPF